MGDTEETRNIAWNRVKQYAKNGSILGGMVGISIGIKKRIWMPESPLKVHLFGKQRYIGKVLFSIPFVLLFTAIGSTMALSRELYIKYAKPEPRKPKLYYLLGQIINNEPEIASSGCGLVLKEVLSDIRREGRMQPKKLLNPVLNAKHLYFNYNFDVRMEEVDPTYKSDNDSLEDKLRQQTETVPLKGIVYENIQSELIAGVMGGLWCGTNLIKFLHPHVFLGGLAASVAYSLIAFGFRDLYYNARDIHWIRDRVISKFNEHINEGELPIDDAKDWIQLYQIMDRNLEFYETDLQNHISQLLQYPLHLLLIYQNFGTASLSDVTLLPKPCDTTSELSSTRFPQFTPFNNDDSSKIVDFHNPTSFPLSEIYKHPKFSSHKPQPPTPVDNTGDANVGDENLERSKKYGHLDSGNRSTI